MSEKFAEAPARVIVGQLDFNTAFERVSSKLGMAGVDGISVSRFRRCSGALIRGLQSRLARQVYTPLPLRVVEIEKRKAPGANKRRLLLVPAVGDRVVQTAVAQWLGIRWNPGFDAHSFAYRPGLGVASALRVLAELRDSGYRWVLDADVRAFFDRIDHQILVENLTQRLGTSPLFGWLCAWISATVWDGADVSRLDCGVLQGSPLSPLLANLYLDSFDRRLRSLKIPFIRYADDFLVLGRTPFEIAEHRHAVEEALAALRLELAPAKTRVISFDQGFRFLGAEMEGESIFLPFEKKKTPMRRVYLAPVMPAALIQAFQAGQLRLAGSFVWKGPPLIPADERPIAKLPPALTALRGKPAPLLSTGLGQSQVSKRPLRLWPRSPERKS